MNKKRWNKSVKSITKYRGLTALFRMLLILCAASHSIAETKNITVDAAPLLSEADTDAQIVLEAEYQDGNIYVETTFLPKQGAAATVRAGRNFVLTVEITAQSTSFSGQINVLMLNEEENNICFSEEITELSAGETRSVKFLLPMNLKTDDLYLTLTDKDENILLEQTIPLNVVNYGNYMLIGIGAEDFFQFDYFRSFGNRLISLENRDFSYGADALDALLKVKKSISLESK